MPFPTDASVVVLLGSWWDEGTRTGMDATITATPVPAAGSAAAANATPNLTDIANYGWIKSRAWSTKPLASGLFALPLIANDDPDLSAFGGYQINPQGETPFLINVSATAPTMAATQQIVDAVAMAASMSSAAFTVSVGQTIQVVRMTEAAVLSAPAPQPPAAFLNEAQINSRIATAVAGIGGGSGTADLPEVNRTTADSTAANLIGKTTRYANTSDVTQTAPPAVPGAVMAIGREVGAANLTLVGATQSGTQDKFGTGSLTSYAYPLDGMVLEWHCTTAGRWRITREHVAQSVRDARYPVTDQSNPAVGKVVAVTGTGPTTYGLASLPSPYTDEQAQDAVAALFAAGTHSGLTFTYDDAGNRIGASFTGAVYTDEQARDAIGAAVRGSDSVQALVDDPSDTITLIADLPEVAGQTAPVAASALRGKTTRFDATTAGTPIVQPLPPAVPGATLALGLDAGPGLQYVADGSDVIGPGAGAPSETVTVASLRVLHCTTAGRWRVAGGFIAPSVLNALYMPAGLSPIAAALVFGG